MINWEFNNQFDIARVQVQKSWYSIEDCENNLDKLFIFGDNTLRLGMAGQAQIRKCQNSCGLATKLNPGMDDGDFMSDNFYDAHCMVIEKDIIKIVRRFENKANGYNKIVFPYDGLGTGLSKLPEKAPRVYNFLCTKLREVFGIVTDENGKLSIPGR